MKTTFKWKKALGLTAGLLLGLSTAGTAHAFSPSQAPILSSSAVKPNVLILLDNSGSMNLMLEPSDVASSSHSKVRYRSGGGGGGGSWSSDYDYLTIDNMGRHDCDSNYVALRAASGSTTRCYRLPDPVGNKLTRYSAKYLSYIFNTYKKDNNDLRNTIPKSYRLGVATDVTKKLISDNRGLRYGLFTFNKPEGGDAGPGGSLRAAPSDIQETYSPGGSLITNAVDAYQNYLSLIKKIEDLKADSNTPLAETYYEMTRYLRGMQPFHGKEPKNGNYTSPIEYRCQKTFSIVVTDGLPTRDSTFPEDDPKRRNPSISGSNNLPNWDGTDNDGPQKNESDEGDTLFLDDMAKFAYDIDMRDRGNDKADKSFNTEGFAKQNMETYTIGFTTSNQMLEDAARYGRGKYYTANDAAQLTESLTLAINAISAKAGSGGAGASSSATLTSNTVYYKTLYDPEGWTGTIEAYQLHPASGRIDETVGMLWSTDDSFRTGGPRYESYNTQTQKPVTLTYNNLSAAQQAQLNTSIAPTATGIQLINWSKGTSVSSLRNRASLLGDVINSPLERVAPETQTVSAITGDTSYDSYLSFKKKNLTTSLLVNANDGFFHILDAETGAHRYAYMPSPVIPLLNIVAEPDYAESGTHRFLVDGQISVSDSQLGSNWATVAVAGMGAGGKSMFAVKLLEQGATSPNTPAALWEVSAPATNTPTNDWNDLGYTYSRAAIARTSDNKWVAVFGNGYGSHAGKAALYVVDLATGTLVEKIVVDDNTGGTAGEQAKGNGLSSPQIVVNAQHQIEKIYAGDLRGNLWRFDASDWSHSKLFSAGSTRPITTYPLITEHPRSGHLISVGTGKLSETSDKLNKDEQIFYTIWDNDSGTEVLNSSLLQQNITVNKTIEGISYFLTTTHEIDWDVHRGWRLPLVQNGVREGERVIYPAQTTEGRVVFVTAKIDANDPCESSGSGRLIELDLLSGSMLNYEVLDTNKDGKIDDKDEITSGRNFNDGLPGAPVIIDRGPEKQTQTKAILLSTGKVEFVDERARAQSVGARRIMWRQIQ